MQGGSNSEERDFEQELAKMDPQELLKDDRLRQLLMDNAVQQQDDKPLSYREKKQQKEM